MYSYDDEDNAPMNDFHNPTVYTSRSEMRYYESGQYERDMEARETAREIRECQTKERFLDNLQLTGVCRSCEWMIEGVYEQYEADDDLEMPAFCYEIAEGLCKVCKATNHDEDAISKYLEEAE